MRVREYKDFSLRIHQKSQVQPLAGHLELTHRCNLACRHCYLSGGVQEKELNLTQWRWILDQIYQEGCLWLTLSGGEPLLRPDFSDIYTYAYRKGFILTVLTNATLLSEKLTRLFQKFPPFSLEVTLNGVTAKTFEAITGCRGSFKQVMRGIGLLREYNLPLKLKTQAMTLNVAELPLLRKFYQSLKLSFSFDTIIEPRLDGSTQPCALRLSLKQLIKLRNKKLGQPDEFWQKGDCAKIDQPGRSNTGLSVNNNYFRCPVGMLSFCINPYGELFICNLVRKPSWNLLRRSFRQGFYQLFSRIRAQKFTADSPCRNCRVWQFCKRCPGRSALECGDPFAPIDYYCQQAHFLAQQAA